MADVGEKQSKEQWGSKLGVIMAVAGSAVGLGNFLRFPGQAAANGGGAFMIPYFISFLLLGIPICWAEWSMGRYGGRHGFNSSPGVFSVLWRNPISKYLGGLGLLVPVVIYMYYVYIESWCLAYAVMYVTGDMDLGKNPAAYGKFFKSFTGETGDGAIFEGGIQPIFWFFVFTFVVNFYFIYRGLSKGIEKFCTYGMPLLLLAAFAVAIRVLTLPEQPLPEPWQIGYAQVLPQEKWDALKAKALDPETTPTQMKEAVAAATDDYFEGILKQSPDYRSDIAVAVPAGFANTPAGFAMAMAELRAGDLGRKYREWIVASRESIPRDSKIELQELELEQYMDKGDAEKIERIVKERAELLALSTAGPMPDLTSVLQGIRTEKPIGVDLAAQQRLAALEASELRRTVANGLGYMWNPDFEMLKNPSVWLAAAGQIFFSLSVGFGVIINYASYLRKDDDVVLSGLTASATNEFCEVCLGGLVAIPATFIFLGAALTMDAIAGSSFGLGFNTLPTVFANMQGGRWFGALWFFLLFLAAITSSLSMLQPAIAFLEEGFGLKRRASVAFLGMITATGSLAVIYFSGNAVVLSTMDDWVGTVAIYVLATIEVLIFGWVIGINKGFAEAHRGADMRIPRIFGPILKFVTPAFLLAIFGAWIVQSLPGKIEQIRDNRVVLVTVVGMGVFFLFLLLLIALAGEQWRKAGRGQQEIDA